MSLPSRLSEAEVARIALKEVDSGRVSRRKERSEDLVADQEVACPVCTVPYYEPDENENGQRMELPLITPCGHIFGHRCFETWRQTCEERDQAVFCPLCRFELHFNCGHVVSPLFAFNPKTPPKIRQEEVPDNCFDCYIESSQYTEVMSMLEDSRRTLDDNTRELWSVLQAEPEALDPPHQHVRVNRYYREYGRLRLATARCVKWMCVYRLLTGKERWEKWEEKRIAELHTNSWRIAWD